MKIAVLLSGGVDSSVALRLLVEEGGHELRACYLKVWLEDDAVLAGDCPWEEDVRYVRAVCEQLGVPLEIVPLQTEYLEHVVDHALGELRAGRTPSPDILCNQRIKFGAFLERVGDCDAVASGHYARVRRENGRAVLLRAADPVKDQTYFLSSLCQQQLQGLLFPVGHLRKQEVRDLAARFQLPTKNRKDSQGICFLGKIDYREFVARRLGKREGPSSRRGAAASSAGTGGTGSTPSASASASASGAARGTSSPRTSSATSCTSPTATPPKPGSAGSSTSTASTGSRDRRNGPTCSASCATAPGRPAAASIRRPTRWP